MAAPQKIMLFCDSKEHFGTQWTYLVEKVWFLKIILEASEYQNSEHEFLPQNEFLLNGIVAKQVNAWSRKQKKKKKNERTKRWTS